MFSLDRHYFSAYEQALGNSLKEALENFDFSDKTVDFSHRIMASAVFSSNIEGNTVDLNSYLNWKMLGAQKPNRQIQEINDLIAAYEFAQTNPLTERNLLEVHKILSQKLLIRSKRGKYRQEKIGVFGESGLVYLAVEPEKLAENMAFFWKEIGFLLSQKLTISEVFYFASLIHLRFAHLHPFADGNGRTARILEKWVLTHFLGKDFWKIPSEKYYKNHLNEYYQNINLGVNFYELQYNRCLSFLLLLPKCLL